MRKVWMILMIFVLALTCACGKDAGKPVQDTMLTEEQQEEVLDLETEQYYSPKTVPEQVTEAAPTEQHGPEPVQEDIPEETAASEPLSDGDAPSEAEEAGAHRTFGQILWKLRLTGTLPDGRQLEWHSEEETEENHFAVTDIDGDGREELLLSWTKACTAGHTFLIYDMHEGEACVQFGGFPALRFYDNAAMEKEWSHNQGWSGRFWPYYAYRYDPERDRYEEIAFVEAWDEKTQPEGFPGDIDADGDGLVYDVRPAGVDWTSGARYASERMMDGPAFEEWRQSYLNGAEEIEMELIPLTLENIAAIMGYDEIRWEKRPDDSRGTRFLYVRKGEHWGFMDGEGRELLDPQRYELDSIVINTYEEVWPIIQVQKDGLWGAVDYRGNLVIDPAWQQVMMFIYDEPKTLYMFDESSWYASTLTYDDYQDVYTYSGLSASVPAIPVTLHPDLR